MGLDDYARVKISDNVVLCGKKKRTSEKQGISFAIVECLKSFSSSYSSGHAKRFSCEVWTSDLQKSDERLDSQMSIDIITFDH